MYKPIVRAEARALQLSADTLCYSRLAAAPILASYILATPKYQTPWLFGTVTGLYVGDKVDGKLSSWSKSLYKKAGIISPGNPELDQKSDKVLTHSLLGAIGIREMLNGNYVFGASVLAMEARSLKRDIEVNRHRDRAQTYSDTLTDDILNRHKITVDPQYKVNTGAIKSGKFKQLFFALGAIAGTAPVPESVSDEAPWVSTRGLVLGLLATGTKLSVSSGVETIQNLDQQITDLKSRYQEYLPVDEISA